MLAGCGGSDVDIFGKHCLVLHASSLAPSPCSCIPSILLLFFTDKAGECGTVRFLIQASCPAPGVWDSVLLIGYMSINQGFLLMKTALDADTFHTILGCHTLSVLNPSSVTMTG